MGIILAPILLLFPVIVFIYITKGIKGHIAVIKYSDTKISISLYSIITTIFFSLVSVLLALILIYNNRINGFALVLHLLFTPLIILIISGALMPENNITLKIVKNCLFTSTLFVLPVAALAQDYALSWFNITMSY